VHASTPAPVTSLSKTPRSAISRECESENTVAAPGASAGRKNLGGATSSPHNSRQSHSSHKSHLNIHTPLSPRDLLLPYQRAWSDDEARFKIGLQARQTGKDFASGEEGIRDCYRAELENNKTTWLIAAPSERQSMESLSKWKEWTEAYQLAIADVTEEREGNKSEALLKSATITFPNGSRVIAVPGKPDTVRGFSANLLLTEFAFFEDADATWRAVIPSITNPLRGGAKKCRLISTPNGIGNKFHDLWTKNYQVPDAKWSCHRVSIWDAVKQGLPVDPEELREALADPEGWAQEFELDFLDTAAVLLPYELIALCESENATEIISPEYWLTQPQFPLFLGIDFGRKRDLTVSWAAESISDLLMTKEVLCLEKMSTPKQVDLLRPRIRRAQRVSLDYTGPGIGMGDYLVDEFGEWKPEQDKFGKIELCTFTNTLKQEIFPKFKMRFESRKIFIPVSRVIREDLHSVHRVTTATSVTYRAPHTLDGHADRATAGALMVRAASYAAGPIAFERCDGTESDTGSPRNRILL
jgi:phage FluMu gp28-like protein